ncbi:predicted protein [Arabidopsis lyrata subsp. lyrata]|uniref:Predicted protein n=1 Tax=Arabidopsis lyrata subsp. lyrata TaxID=81972 RepID=D7LDC0_ARALL|nr:predicted protein [Arabidopsis lyrata subsp. lyrata]
MRFNTPSLVYLDYSGFAPTSSSIANFLDSLVEAKLDVILDSNLHHDVTLRQKDGVLVDLSTIMNWMRNVKTLSLSSASVKGLHCVSSQGLCIDRNEVKVLEIYGFSGRDREVRQVTCFLREMQFLQVLKVEIDARDNNKLRLINHLLALPGLSSKLQIMFL